MNCNDCQERVTNCGPISYAMCVRYEGSLPEFSTLRDYCNVTVQDTVEELYTLFQSSGNNYFNGEGILLQNNVFSLDFSKVRDSEWTPEWGDIRNKLKIKVAGVLQEEVDNTVNIELSTDRGYGVVKLGSSLANGEIVYEPSRVVGRTYPIQNNVEGKLVVNVPWTGGSGNLTGENGIRVLNSVISPVYGNTANTVVEGDDQRVNNGQTAYTWGDHRTMNYVISGSVYTNLEVDQKLNVKLEGYDLEGFLNGVSYNQTNHQITFNVKNRPNVVIDLPIEQLIKGVELQGNDLVFTFENGSTTTVPMNTLLVGVIKKVNGLSPNSQGEVVLNITDIPNLDNILNSKTDTKLSNLASNLNYTEKTEIKNKLGITDTVYSQGTGITISGNTITNSSPNANHTGDVHGSSTLTIQENVVTNSKLSKVPALTFKGNLSYAEQNVEDLTLEQLREYLKVGSRNIVLTDFSNTIEVGINHQTSVFVKCDLNGEHIISIGSGEFSGQQLFLQFNMYLEDNADSASVELNGKFINFLYSVEEDVVTTIKLANVRELFLFWDEDYDCWMTRVPKI